VLRLVACACCWQPIAQPGRMFVSLAGSGDVQAHQREVKRAAIYEVSFRGPRDNACAVDRWIKGGITRCRCCYRSSKFSCI
jgi:hypothetical protein